MHVTKSLVLSGLHCTKFERFKGKWEGQQVRIVLQQEVVVVVTVVVVAD